MSEGNGSDLDSHRNNIDNHQHGSHSEHSATRRDWLKAIGAATLFGAASDTVGAVSSSNTVSVGSGSYSTVIPSGYQYPSPPTADTLKTTSNVDTPIPSNSTFSGFHFGYNPYDDVDTPYCNGAAVVEPYYAEANSDGLVLQNPNTWQGWRNPWDSQVDQPAPIEDADFIRMDYQEAPRLVVGNTASSSYADTRTHDYGDWHHVARWGDGTSAAMDATLVRGSPFTFIEYASGGAEISLLDSSDSAIDTANVSIFSDQGNVLGITVQPADSSQSTQHFGLYAPSSATWSGKGTATLTSNLNGAGYLTVAVLPDGTQSTLEEFKQYAYNFVRDTTVDWTYNQTDSNGNPVSEVSETFSFTLEQKAESTASGTVAALFPTQWKNMNTTFSGHEYWSPKGTMKTLTGVSSFGKKMTYPGILPHMPDAGTYDGATLDSYIDDLTSVDPYTNQGVPACAYWADKDLMRNALSAEVADVRNKTAAKDFFVQAIRGRLSTYLDVENNSWSVGGTSYSTEEGKELFYYHDDLGEIQSYPGCEFGAIEALNDHHFHFGYMVYAASVVARNDPQWADNYGDMVELLIRDYANWERPNKSNAMDPSSNPKDSFPFLRNFDPYLGSSYAGGINGNDWGNNQESNSEAVNAYAAMIRWGEFRLGQASTTTEREKARQIRDTGIYLYTNEIEAAREYWFDESGDTLPDTWGQNLTADELSTTEGAGPFEYASQTWDVGFWRNVYWDTADPVELYGINWVPGAPHTFYLGYDQQYAANNWQRMLDARDALARGPGGDQSLMSGWEGAAWSYRAYHDPADAARLVDSEGPIDPSGTSTAFIYHYVHCLNQVGTPVPGVTADTPFFQVFDDGTDRTYIAYNASSSSTTVTFSDGTSFSVGANSLGMQVGSGSTSDTTAPTEPANLTSTGTTSSSVSLSWDASSDSGTGVDHYNVYVDGTKDQQVAAGTTSATVDSLSASTTYDFTVSAVDGAGNESTAAGPLSVTTDSSSDTTAPTAPSNLTSTGHTDTSVSLSWDASSDSGTGVDHYNVYVDGTKDQQVAAGTTSATVSSLASSTTYDFTVSAVDGAGNESSTAGPVSVTTDSSSTSSSAPAIDSFSVSNSSNGGWASFNVNWSVSDADGDLSSVTVELRQNGVQASKSISVSGSSASGQTNVRDKKGSGTYDIVLTVTDAAGNSTSQTQTVTA